MFGQNTEIAVLSRNFGAGDGFIDKLAFRRCNLQVESIGHFHSKSAGFPLGLLLKLFSSLEDIVDRALHVEGLLGESVVFPIDDLLETADCVGELDVLARPVNCSATWKGWERNC